MPTAVEIEEGIRALVAKPTFAQKYKLIDGPAAFKALLDDLKAWLEVNDCGELIENRDKLLVARVIKASFSDKFAFGKVKKIGGVDYNTLQPVVDAQPLGPPVYTDLDESWAANKGKYSVVRRDVARVLGISDKGHSHHGANFSGTQTLRQIILNLFSTIQGAEEQQRIRASITQRYRFTA